MNQTMGGDGCPLDDPHRPALFSHSLVQGAPIPTHLPLASQRLTFTVFSFGLVFGRFLFQKCVCEMGACLNFVG